eukprot:5086865-Karenia_brevis.AAC.1
MKGNDSKKHDDKKRVSKITTQRASFSAGTTFYACEAVSDKSQESRVSCMAFKCIAKEAMPEASQEWTDI